MKTWKIENMGPDGQPIEDPNEYDAASSFEAVAYWLADGFSCPDDFTIADDGNGRYTVRFIGGCQDGTVLTVAVSEA